jgi:hypothetical protein
MNIEIIEISDSGYAKDKVTRRSVTGYIVSVNGAIISTKSKMQESVTHLATEAKLVAASHLKYQKGYQVHWNSSEDSNDIENGQ